MNCLRWHCRDEIGSLPPRPVFAIRSSLCPTPKTGASCIIIVSLTSRIPANCAWSKQDRFASLYSPPMPAENGSRTSHLLNSGLVVLHPSQAAMDSIVHFINTSPTIGSVKHPDQDVLAQLFHGRWRPLPWWTNALKPARAVHSDVWADTEVRLIHYM
jgi:hypothetical protein